MSRLKVLVACENRLEAVEAICNATSLRVLVLFNNAIKELPTEFSRLTKLVHLELSGNSIALVRKAVVNMVLPHAEHVGVDRGLRTFLERFHSRLLRLRPHPATYIEGEARAFHDDDEASLREGPGGDLATAGFGSPTLLTWTLFR